MAGIATFGDIPAPQPITDDEYAATRRYVARKATSPSDERLLLEALGLEVD